MRQRVAQASTLTGWYKSSYSGGNNDNCVRTASGHTLFYRATSH
ncbi:DUF397 domain-containing protein [Streptomyces sp. NPDC052051]